MKVAILIERFDIALGGAERSVSELTEELNRQGIHAVILAASGRGDPENVRILCSGSNKRTSLAEFEKAVADHLKENPYDIIHSTLPVSCADLYQPRGGSYKEAMLQNAHSYPTRAGRWFKRTFHFFNARRTEMIRAEQNLIRSNPQVIVAALSQYVKRQFMQHYALPEDRIAVIANGVKIPETSNPEPIRKLRQEYLAQTGFADSPQTALFLFAAHNFRLKGLAELIRAFRFGGQDTSAGLIAAGSGKQKAYMKLAADLGIRKRVFFAGPLGSIQDSIAACDAVVLPTYYDPSSRVILEALALGKPVITTAFNGAAENIRSGRHGIVIAHPRNTKALAEAMAFYCKSKHRQTTQQAIAEDNLPQKVSIQRHVKELISLYKSILDRKNSTP